jgi:hypothetical protein
MLEKGENLDKQERSRHNAKRTDVETGDVHSVPLYIGGRKALMEDHATEGGNNLPHNPQEEPGALAPDEEVISQQTVQFLDDSLLVLLTASDRLYISLPNLCAALTLNARGQLQRIQRTPGLVEGLRLLPARTRGGTQRLNCLWLEKLPAWLSGLHLRGTKQASRAKIKQYRDQGVTEITRLFYAAESPALPMLPIQGTLPFPATETVIESSIETMMTLDPTLTTLPTVTPDQQELRALMTQLPYIPTSESLVTTSYQEDRAIREATLARKVEWEEEPEFQRMRYIASNKLHVYFGDPDHPLELNEALERIRSLGESTILTARILLGLWNIRRCERQLAKDGSAAIRVDEILEWRGVQKHSRTYSLSEKRFSDGFQWKHKQQVFLDVKLLEHCYLRGHHTVIVRGRAQRFRINGPYLRVTSVEKVKTGEQSEIVGYFIAPGAWINTYEEHGNIFFAEIDRRVFQLNPQNDQLALRIALFLTEHWRQHARTGQYAHPMVMRDLLTASMIPIDTRHLTNRFVPRVEAALMKLLEQGVVGEVSLLTPIDKQKAHWGRDWLASEWRILPPSSLISRYLDSIQSELPEGRRRRTSY